MIARLAILALVLPQIAAALPLEFPATANRMAFETEPGTRAAIAVGAYADGQIPMRAANGALTRQVWQLPHNGRRTLQILEPLAAQLASAGYEELYSCETNVCGGFDFRFGIDILPAPAMHVDLGDFRYFAAARPARGEGDASEDEELIALLISRSGASALIHVQHIGAAAPDITAIGPDNSGQAPRPVAPDMARDLPLAEALERFGHAVLPDVTFETASSKLAEGGTEALTALAAYLVANPNRRVVLVGHTDSEGGLQGNIALSKRRAGAVRDRLISEFNVPSAQLEAEGMGYLSPVATNLTEAGREANRRVEAVLISTE